MNKRTTLLSIATAVASAVIASPVIAGSSADTHAWLEGQRTITDGQTVPLDTRANAHRGAMKVKQSAEDRWFLAELARTEGNTAPVKFESERSPGNPGWMGALLRLFK